MGKITTIFFDAGGTLLHPRDPVGQTYAEVAGRYGATLDPVALEQGFRSAFKQLKHRPVESIPRDGNDRGWWQQVVRLALAEQLRLPDFPFDEFFETLYLTYENPVHWELYPEVRETLDLLQQRGYRMAVISNWDSRLRVILEGHSLMSYFNGIFISSEWGSAKPHPELYRWAQNSLGCQAEEVLMIGDDPINDQQVPQSLGWQARLVDRPVLDLRSVLKFLINQA
jgi:putative hydrolase of the HAD superfamily